jgi:hypothetical protein
MQRHLSCRFHTGLCGSREPPFIVDASYSENFSSGLPGTLARTYQANIEIQSTFCLEAGKMMASHL